MRLDRLPRNHPSVQGLSPGSDCLRVRPRRPRWTYTEARDDRLLDGSRRLPSSTDATVARSVWRRESSESSANGRRRADPHEQSRRFRQRKGAAHDAVSRSRLDRARARSRAGRRLVVGHQVQRRAVVGQSRAASTASPAGSFEGTFASFQKDIHPGRSARGDGGDPGEPAHRQALSRALPARAARRTRRTAGSRRSPR